MMWIGSRGSNHGWHQTRWQKWHDIPSGWLGSPPFVLCTKLPCYYTPTLLLSLLQPSKLFCGSVLLHQCCLVGLHCGIKGAKACKYRVYRVDGYRTLSWDAVFGVGTPKKSRMWNHQLLCHLLSNTIKNLHSQFIGRYHFDKMRIDKRTR